MLRYEFHRRKLPKNTNFALIGRWKRLASSNLPILLFTAHTTKPRHGEFDYIRYLELCSRRSRSFVVKHIEGTDHSFLRGPGKEAIRTHVARWLYDHFPASDASAEGKYCEQQAVTEVK